MAPTEFPRMSNTATEPRQRIWWRVAARFVADGRAGRIDV